MTARKLKTLPIRHGTTIQVGEMLELRVLRKGKGILCLEILGDQDFPIKLVKSPRPNVNCKRRKT